MNLSPPAHYTVGPGEIHIWQIPLPSSHASLANLPDLLSPPERERAARFALERDQVRFIACRASLRLLLSRYTGIPPHGILFRQEPHGKPALAGAPDWHFNVSHSRDLAAIAISRSAPVGIDLEFIDPNFPCDEVAPEVFAREELRDLATLPPDVRLQNFFRLWTLKEALLKAVGHGFSQEPRQIQIRLRESLSPEIVSAPSDFAAATLQSLTLHPSYAAALAVLSPISDISLFTL